MERDNFNQRKYVFYNQVIILVCIVYIETTTLLSV